MKNILSKFLLSLLIFPLLTSCQQPNSSSTPSGEGGDDNPPIEPGPVDPENPEEKEDIYDMGYETIKIEEEEYYQISKGLYVNKTPGLYKEGFDLKFAYNQDKGQLYFNYDGETPLQNQLCSLAPFKEIEIYERIPTDIDELPMSTSVDEILDSKDNRCVSENYINNVQKPMKYAYFNNACVINITFKYQEELDTMALTYLVDSKNEYSIPLVFLSMPYRKWFGSPYYFYNNIKEEPEHRVELEFFDPVTEEYWSRNSKIKLGGGWSKGYPQRTLNLNFKKDENGDKNEKVEYPIFGDRKMVSNPKKDVSKFIRFRLHNGGNCFEQWSGFNDAIIQRAMFGSNVATTAYRPCLVYLNGEYWGLMSLREHYSDYYIKQNFGVDDENVTMFELKGNLIYDDGSEDGLTYINQLENFLNDSRFNSSNQDLVEEAFHELAEMIDIDSFIDMLIAEFYSCNWDFVGNNNNLKMWRVMETSDKKFEDGKWRFCLHDIDFAFSENTNFFDKNVNNSYNNWRLLRKCMLSKEFRNALILRAEELAASNLDAKRLEDITKAMYDEVRPYKKDSGKRWGQPNSYFNDWINYYSYLINYYKNRSGSFVEQLRTTINNQYGGF